MIQHMLTSFKKALFDSKENASKMFRFIALVLWSIHRPRHSQDNLFIYIYIYINIKLFKFPEKCCQLAAFYVSLHVLCSFAVDMPAVSLGFQFGSNWLVLYSATKCQSNSFILDFSHNIVQFVSTFKWSPFPLESPTPAQQMICNSYSRPLILDFVQFLVNLISCFTFLPIRLRLRELLPPEQENEWESEREKAF